MRNHSIPILTPAALVCLLLFVSACSHIDQGYIKIPHPKNSPDGQISMISFWPASRCVVDVNDAVEAQFRIDVPEGPCQVFARLKLPEEYSELSEHGFTSGSSACPALLNGHGILKQSFCIFYNPKTDQKGIEDNTHPSMLRATNVIFTVYPGSIGDDPDRPLSFIRDDSGGRRVYSVPVDMTWICKKTPCLEYLHELRLREWNEVKQLHPDAHLPEKMQKSSRYKKNGKVPDYLTPVMP